MDWKRGEATRAKLDEQALRKIEQATEMEAKSYLENLEKRKQQALDLIKGK